MSPSPRKCHIDVRWSKKCIPDKVRINKKGPLKRSATESAIIHNDLFSNHNGSLLSRESDPSSVRRNKFRKTQPSPKKRCSWRKTHSQEDLNEEDSVLSSLYDSPVKSHSRLSCSNSQPARALFDDQLDHCDSNLACDDNSLSLFMEANKLCGPTDFSHLLNPDQQTNHKSVLNKDENESNDNFLEKQPVDWRLAHSLRVTSNCKLSSEHMDSDFSYYQYPFLPWLSFFPRQFDAVKKNRCIQSGIAEWCSSEMAKTVIIPSIIQLWQNSLDSIYKALENGLVSYFYVCCSEFTTVFLNNNGLITAALSPAPKNLQNEMIKAGIQFEPKDENLKSSRLSGDSVTWNGVEHSEYSMSRDAYSQPAVLPSMKQKIVDSDKSDESEFGESPTKAIEALDCLTPKTKEHLKKRLPLRRSRTDLAKQAIKAKEEKACVIISHSSMQSLLNFIASERCRPKSGPYQGLPPTIIARNEFENSTKRRLTVKSNCESRRNDKFWMEISGGPVLPCVFHSLTESVTQFADKFECSVGGRNFYTELSPNVDRNLANENIFSAVFANFYKLNFDGKGFICT